MTYLAFHAVFIVPPILLLGWYQRRAWDRLPPRAGLFLLLIAAIAFVYATPWDNYLVWRGIWNYGEGRVVGTVGFVPAEEYLFFLLQPVLTGLWLYSIPPVEPAPTGGAARVIGAAVSAAISICGVVMLGRVDGLYLGLILVWAGPVLALQWLYAGTEIWARKRLWALGVAVPTLYLWMADALAIQWGIWRISEVHTLGPTLGPLPLEEAAFFLATNLLVVQGLILFLFPRPQIPSSQSTRSGAYEPAE